MDLSADGADLFWSQMRGRSASKVNLDDLTIRMDSGCIKVDFAEEVSDVFVDWFTTPRYDNGACAEPAQRVTERKVEVQGERPAARHVVVCNVHFPVGQLEGIREMRCGRIGSVPGTESIVLANKVEIYFDFHGQTL